MDGEVAETAENTSLCIHEGKWRGRESEREIQKTFSDLIITVSFTAN